GYFAHRHSPSFPTRRSSDLFTHAELRRPVAIEDAENVGQVLFARRFIERKTNALLIEAAEIHPVRFSELRYFRGPCAHAHPNRIDRKSTRLNSSHQIISYAV